jgi:hypothetical protein
VDVGELAGELTAVPFLATDVPFLASARVATWLEAARDDTPSIEEVLAAFILARERSAPMGNLLALGAGANALVPRERTRSRASPSRSIQWRHDCFSDWALPYGLVGQSGISFAANRALGPSSNTFDLSRSQAEPSYPEGRCTHVKSLHVRSRWPTNFLVLARMSVKPKMRNSLICGEVFYFPKLGKPRST